MILTAHQPVYLPWLGLFHKIAMADRFCIFDIAQYQTKDFNNRNKIKTNAGSIWLSVPVESKDHFEKKLCDIKVVNNGWNRKHFKSIDLAYKKAPYYSNYIGTLEDILASKTYTYLADLNFATLDFGLKALGIAVPIDTASKHEFEGAKSDLVLDMCKKLGASRYVFGAQGRNYADLPSFAEAGIAVDFQDYQHPVYPQLHGGFEPYMSVIDLLFNVGPESFNVLMSGNVSKKSG
ncbi:WbqC family protein [soil metagenome]